MDKSLLFQAQRYYHMCYDLEDDIRVEEGRE